MKILDWALGILALALVAQALTPARDIAVPDDSFIARYDPAPPPRNWMPPSVGTVK